MVIIVFILVVLLLLFLQRSTIPKIIWILWLQGWDDDTPYLAKSVRKSWELHNPGWEVRAISKDSEYIRGLKLVESPAASSDIIRLHLLSKYGGIWADASMLCMKPIDDLVNTIQSNVWMYHGRNDCKLLASWFIIATADSYMMKKWKESSDEYWKNRESAHDYSWMDILWMELYEKDEKFKNEWNDVYPKICCEDHNQPHMLRWVGVNGENTDTQKIIDSDPPYAIKLSFHEFDETNMNTNGNFAIKKSLGY